VRETGSADSDGEHRADGSLVKPHCPSARPYARRVPTRSIQATTKSAKFHATSSVICITDQSRSKINVGPSKTTIWVWSFKMPSVFTRRMKR